MACYNVVVFGEPGVGKTCFVDQFCHGKSFVSYLPDASIITHEIIVDGLTSHLMLMDLSTSFLKPEIAGQPPGWAEKMLREADGVVLLYDVTSAEGFEYIINQAYNFLWECRRLKEEADGGAGRSERKSFGCVLAGNKLDLVIAKLRERAVDPNLAEEWAHTQGFRNIELDSLTSNGPKQALMLLVRNLRKLDRLSLARAKEEEQAARSMKGKDKTHSIRNAIKGALRSSGA